MKYQKKNISILECVNLLKNGISFKEAIIIISTENKMMKEGFIE